RQGRCRRRLPQLRDRLRGVEGKGAGYRRQRANALFHRASASPAGSEHRCQTSYETGPLKKLLRDTLRSSWFQRAVGFLAAEYLRLVWNTNHFVIDPPNVYERVEPQLPGIFAFWHGQHFLTPFIRARAKGDHKAKVLISMHRDGEYNAIAA